MKRILLSTFLALLGSTALHAQVYTNMPGNLQDVFLSLSPGAQAQLQDCYTNYQRAAKSNPLFSYMQTNVVDGVTNVVEVHPKMNFASFFKAALAEEKVSRVVRDYTRRLEAEISDADTRKERAAREAVTP